MIDTQLLGETAAKCMEDLDESEALHGGEVLAVGIVVVIQTRDDTSATRTYSSERVYYRQHGLFQAGLHCVESGQRYTPPAFGGDDVPDE